MRVPMPNDPVSSAYIYTYHTKTLNIARRFPKPLTDQERLALHAKIVSYQRLDGASYLAACDLLYFEELAKLQYAVKQMQGWKELQDMAQNFKKELISIVANDQLWWLGKHSI